MEVGWGNLVFQFRGTASTPYLANRQLELSGNLVNTNRPPTPYLILKYLSWVGYHNWRIKNIFLPGIEPTTFMPTDTPIIPLSYSSSMKWRRNPKSFRSKALHRRQEKYFVFSCFGLKPSSEPCIHEWATTIEKLKCSPARDPTRDLHFIYIYSLKDCSWTPNIK